MTPPEGLIYVPGVLAVAEQRDVLAVLARFELQPYVLHDTPSRRLVRSFGLARVAGAYDLGPERCSWLIQGMTDWIGDNGRLTRLEAKYLKFNYMGDVTWVQGKVTDKFEHDGKGFVRCAVECVNHRDEVTATAVAEAELPRR